MGPKHVRVIVRSVAAVALGCGAVLAMASPGQATVIEREHYSGTFTDVHTDCGFPVEVAGSFSGVAHLRVGKGDQASAFFLHDNFRYREVHTNPANGSFVVISGNGLFHEVRATPLGDDLFEFTAIESGQPFVLEDEEGNVVLRDRGVIFRSVVFDTGGDDVPGGSFVELLDVSVRGPHPGFDEGLAVACELLD